jgi:glycosyltransferase involved in cell wall biosynthesis
MRVAMLAPIAWRTPPRHYGPWENVVSLLTEGLVDGGIDVTLFATGDSQTRSRLVSVCAKGYEEDPEILPKVWECLHISEVFERGEQFDLIHNHFDYLPLTYMGMTTTPVVTTIHGFSSPKILPVYKKYNKKAFYVAISEADRCPELDYIATIHHGIDLHQFTFRPEQGEYLLFFGRIHREKGARECIEIARQTGMKLILAGVIQDRDYFDTQVRPYLDENRIIYVGSAGPKKRDELLGGAYALLHPINFDEPFGLSVVEAMACGTPVIAVNRGSMPEIIADGLTGFLVRDSDEMTKAVAKAKQIDRFRCRKWVEERFSTERMAQDYIRVYERITQQTKRESHRRWGFYETLSDTADHKVKRITLYPGQQLSYQGHFRGSQHWYVISGKAVVTRNDQDTELTTGQAVDLPLGSWHRIRNSGSENMVFIEVQSRDYFTEHEIERSEDDYGRA